MEFDITIEWPTRIDADAVGRLAALLLDTSAQTDTERVSVPIPEVSRAGKQGDLAGGESC